MLNDKGVSIIIPMYNAEHSITQCVDSILNANKLKYEIIIIDDGSKDNSLSIVKEKYSQIDNIRIVSQKNKGVSATRNVGIDLALYEYIAFVDADDTVVDGIYEELSKILEKGFDIAICGYNIVNKNNLKYVESQECIDGEYDICDFAKEYFRFFELLITNTNWNKLYKKNIIKKNNLKFKTNLKMAEDAVFNLEYLECINSVGLTSKKLYNYVISETQTIYKVYPDYYDMLKQFYLTIKQFLDKYDAFNVNKNLFYKNYSVEITNAISQISREQIPFVEKHSKVKKIYSDELFLETIKQKKVSGIKYKLLSLKMPGITLMLFIIKNKLFH